MYYAERLGQVIWWQPPACVATCRRRHRSCAEDVALRCVVLATSWRFSDEAPVIPKITARNAATAIAAGASGVAVCQAVTAAPDPENAARTIKEQLPKADNTAM